MTRGLAWAGACVLAATWSACGRPATPPPAQPLDAVVAGCARADPESGCVLPPGPGPAQLTFWIGSVGGAAAKVWIDGRDHAPMSRRQGSQGESLTLSVPAAARRVAVESGGRRLELALIRQTGCPAVDAAQDLRASGDSKAAVSRLDAPPTQPPGEADAACDRAASSLRARLALDAGDTDRAVEGLARAMTAHHGAAEWSAWAADGFALAFVLVFRSRDFQRARAVLDGLAGAAERVAEARARGPYYRGRLELEAGNLRAALDALAEARLWAERLGMTRLRDDVLQARVDALQVLGRWDDASAEAARLIEGAAALEAGCAKAHRLANAAWLEVARREAGQAGGRPSPRPQLDQALAAYRAGCPEPRLELNVRVNQALTALHEGDQRAAEEALAAAAALGVEPDAYVATWREDAAARLALRAGRPADALARYERLARGTTDLDEARWRAVIGRARALAALGRVDDALVAYADAEDRLDLQLRLVPVGTGRGSFAGDRERGARERIDLLLRTERTDEALAAARRSRARVIRSLQRVDRLNHLGPAARTGWELGLEAFRTARREVERLESARRTAPLDEQPDVVARLRRAEAEARAALDRAYAAATGTAADLAARGSREPEPGELMITWHPLPVGWVGLAATTEGVASGRSPRLPPLNDTAALSQVLLEPFAAQIAAARRITLLPYGPLAGLDLHALPWREGVLLDAAPVAYGLDTTPTPKGRPREAAGALVVADADGNLRGARADGAYVAQRLEAAGFSPVAALTGSAVTRQAVFSGLGSVTWLHWSGHASASGREGWDSALELAGTERLVVSDLLALPKVPDVAVLSGCQTGATVGGAPVTTLGLAQAFVTAGAGSVIATARPVEDALAERLSRLLYEPMPQDPVAGLRRAQRALQRSCPACDWQAWRALVP